MSSIASAWVWKHSPAKGSALLLLLAIAEYARDDGTGAWPSIAKLAEKTRLSTRAVQHLLRQLEHDELLLIGHSRGPGGANLYDLCIPANFQSPDPVDPLYVDRDPEDGDDDEDEDGPLDPAPEDPPDGPVPPPPPIPTPPPEPTDQPPSTQPDSPPDKSQHSFGGAKSFYGGCKVFTPADFSPPAKITPHAKISPPESSAPPENFAPESNRIDSFEQLDSLERKEESRSIESSDRAIELDSIDRIDSGENSAPAADITPPTNAAGGPDTRPLGPSVAPFSPHRPLPRPGVTGYVEPPRHPLRPNWTMPPPLARSPYIEAVIADLSLEFGEPQNTQFNRNRASRLWTTSGLDEPAFAELLDRAHAKTEEAQARPSHAPIRSRMAYFFTVLQGLLAEASPQPLHPTPPASPHGAEQHEQRDQRGRRQQHQQTNPRTGATHP